MSTSQRKIRRKPSGSPMEDDKERRTLLFHFTDESMGRHPRIAPNSSHQSPWDSGDVKLTSGQILTLKFRLSLNYFGKRCEPQIRMESDLLICTSKIVHGVFNLGSKDFSIPGFGSEPRE